MTDDSTRTRPSSAIFASFSPRTSSSGKTRQLAGASSLIEAGVIDSTGVLELVGFLEETLTTVRIDDEELLPENLDSIDNIVAFVERKDGPVSGVPSGRSLPTL